MPNPYSQGQTSIPYSVSGLSGTMAAALGADSEIFQFRWNNTNRKCIINSVSLDGLSGSATAFTAGFGKVALSIARGWTADGSGGTTLTPTGDIAQLRSADALTGVGAIRIATTAALGAGTKTIDTVPIGIRSQTFGTVVSVQYVTEKFYLFDHRAANQPITLEGTEGITVTATVPATGTWQFGITVQWQETN
jgi:hypothetical protein